MLGPAAHAGGANTLSAAIAAQHPEWPLRAGFAIWHGMPSQAIVDSTYLTGFAAFHDRDGRHLLALEADNLTIRVWDPIARKYVGARFEAAGDWIRSVTAMPIRGRGDVLVVNVDTRAESGVPESTAHEDVQDYTDEYAHLEDEDEDEGPFDDYRNSWPSGKRSVIQFFHSDTGCCRSFRVSVAASSLVSVGET